VTLVILGAGDVGAALARHVAAAGTVSRVVLVDPMEAVAAGKALDIAQAAPLEGSATALRGTGDTSTVIGADFVAVADRAGQTSSEWDGEAGLALVARIAELNPHAPILCAGAGQGPLVERGVAECGIARSRIFGTAPEALRSGVVALVALEAGAAATDVCLALVGRAPRHFIVPWEAASIAGRQATDVLAPPAIARLESQLARLWPPAPLTLGAAAARVIRSMVMRSPQIHALLTVPAADGGRKPPAAILPACVHARGIRAAETPALSARDRVRFETALTS
jgi:malate/lactate dehydrogenase